MLRVTKDEILRHSLLSFLQNDGVDETLRFLKSDKEKAV